MDKKIFILLPDGVGLRNFAFTDFHQIGVDLGFHITFWNSTLFNLSNLGFEEIKIENPKLHPSTDLYKRAQIQIELNQNIIRSNNSIYDSYRFPFTQKTVRQIIKTKVQKWIIFSHNSKNGLQRLKNSIKKNERKTKHYFESIETLKKHNPDIVFCTNQRVTTAVSPILAAQDLGIPTATFIFSWDNLPKGTKIIDTDYYFVWSNHMKAELLYYYPDINENQIFVTGTPQFEPHFDKKLIVPKDQFFEEFNLDNNKKYICFSGDDETTSPNDQYYLLDLAKAIKELNLKGFNLGIIFRRCPVDFSNRYDKILDEYSDIIKSINPRWEKISSNWDSILPLKDDISLLVNTINYSECVVNIASSMVFDFVAFNKPCAYLNYEIKESQFPKWSAKKIYNFIHFKSMPNKNAVFWVNQSDDIKNTIESMLNQEIDIVKNAKKWFEVINHHPVEQSSNRIWNAIDTIISMKNE